MKFVQHHLPTARMDIKLERKFCCIEAEQQRHGFIRDRDRAYCQPELTKEHLNFKFCPFCGEEVKIINVWPSREELEKVIYELRHLCGHEDEWNLDGEWNLDDLE